MLEFDYEFDYESRACRQDGPGPSLRVSLSEGHGHGDLHTTSAPVQTSPCGQRTVAVQMDCWLLNLLMTGASAVHNVLSKNSIQKERVSRLALWVAYDKMFTLWILSGNNTISTYYHLCPHWQLQWALRNQLVGLIKMINWGSLQES